MSQGNSASELRDVIVDPGKEGYNLLQSPFYLIAHADFQYHAEMESLLARHGTSTSIYRVLTVLRLNDTMSITDLARHALIKRNTVSRLVERMKTQEFVNVSSDPQDNRVTLVQLSDHGRALLGRLTPLIGRLIARAFDGIEAQDMRTLVGVLNRIVDNLDAPQRD